MASGKRSRVRLSLGVEFDNLAAKAAFTSRFEYVRSLLTPAGQRSIDNLGLLSALFDLVEGSVLPSLPVVSRALSGQLPGTSRSLLQLVLCSHSIQMQVSTCLHICMSNKFYNGAIHI